MKVLSLFSGVGGFDLGFKRAGMEVVGMCEIDKYAQITLQKQFPEATLHTDVKEIKYERGSVDLICGGFPCQDLSVAGKRQGLAGNRSGLWFEFARVIDEVEPKWVVIENVPGLFSSDGGRDLAIIIQWLAQRGYGVGWRMLDSQGFGLAQRRKRVFIVASLGNPSACTLLLEPESLRRNSAKSRGEEHINSRAVANSLTAGNSNDESHGTLIPQLSGTLTARKGRRNNIQETMPPIANTLTSENAGDSSKKSATVVIGTFTGEEKLSPVFKKNPYSSVAFKMRTTGGNNVPIVGVRKLTPIECERLQGFPDGWTTGNSDSQRYKQLGNAVSVPVAEWIGRRIMEKEYGK